MSAPTTDPVIRVKALRSIAAIFTSRTIDQQVFDVLLRMMYSNVWIMVDPGLLCFKFVETAPKAIIISLIERLARTRVAIVYRTRNEDFTRSLYIVKFNPRMVSKISRRKTNKYTVNRMSKIGSVVVGDEIIIDKDKVHSDWFDKFVFKSVNNGNERVSRFVALNKLEWERVL